MILVHSNYLWHCEEGANAIYIPMYVLQMIDTTSNIYELLAALSYGYKYVITNSPDLKYDYHLEEGGPKKLLSSSSLIKCRKGCLQPHVITARCCCMVGKSELFSKYGQDSKIDIRVTVDIEQYPDVYGFFIDEEIMFLLYDVRSEGSVYSRLTSDTVKVMTYDFIRWFQERYPDVYFRGVVVCGHIHRADALVYRSDVSDLDLQHESEKRGVSIDFLQHTVGKPEDEDTQDIWDVSREGYSWNDWLKKKF